MAVRTAGIDKMKKLRHSIYVLYNLDLRTSIT